MNFVVSSNELLNHLQTVSRVISTKNTLPILNDFLFELTDDKELIITASDLETTLTSRLELENASGSGRITLPARLLTEILKESPDQPLTFEINTENLQTDILSETGKYNIGGQNADEYPKAPQLKEDTKTSFTVNAKLFFSGINKAIFATADDELRPVMNGIFIKLENESLTFVASDSHKLVRYIRNDAKPGTESDFILPKKPASLLKSILPKEEGDISIEFDDKNVNVSLPGYQMVCRLVEGKFPSYNSVIPQDNPNKLTLDRLDFYNALKRVSIFSSAATNLIKLGINGNQLTVSAQDLDFSVSGEERLNCQYEGEDMDIGFKSVFLLENLQNLNCQQVQLELSDPSRAGIMVPAENENQDEDVLMLLMPMMIKA